MSSTTTKATATVLFRQRLRVPVRVPPGVTRVVWSFETKDADIKFGASFIPEASATDSPVKAPVEVYAPERVESHLLKQIGAYEGEAAGTLVLEWDNTYSLWTSKNLSYEITVDNVPATQEAERGAGGSAMVVRTPWGPACVREVRPDGIRVAQLGYGVAYLQPEVLQEVPSGPGEPKTLYELERVDCVMGMLRQRTLTEEEAAFCSSRCVMRYLKQAHWNVMRAFDNLAATLQWRFVDQRPFELLQLDVGQVREGLESMFVFIAGYDLQQRPIVVFRMRQNKKEAWQSKLRTTLYAIEKALTMVEGGTDEIVLVVDFGSFGRNNLEVQLARAIVTTLLRHYPGRCGTTIFVNTPAMFQMVWKALEAIIPRTVQKTLLWLRSDRDEASLKALTALMDRKVLNAVLATYPEFDLLLNRAPRAPESTSGAAAGSGSTPAVAAVADATVTSLNDVSLMTDASAVSDSEDTYHAQSASEAASRGLNAEPAGEQAAAVVESPRQQERVAVDTASPAVEPSTAAPLTSPTAGEADLTDVAI